MIVSKGDLLLVPFPFSDQSGKKVRPVVVVSNDNFNETSGDLIVFGITSNILKDRFSIFLTNEDLEHGKLFDPCIIKVENILRINKDLIIKTIGKIKKNKLEESISLFNSIIN
mgnify:CR=1 FL=1